jgi:hypothetical protein
MFGRKIEPSSEKEWSHNVFSPLPSPGVSAVQLEQLPPSASFALDAKVAPAPPRRRVAPCEFREIFAVATYFPEKCCERERIFAIRIVTQISRYFIPKIDGFH